MEEVDCYQGGQVCHECNEHDVEVLLHVNGFKLLTINYFDTAPFQGVACPVKLRANLTNGILQGEGLHLTLAPIVSVTAKVAGVFVGLHASCACLRETLTSVVVTPLTYFGFRISF